MVYFWLARDGFCERRMDQDHFQGRKADGREKKMSLNTEMKGEEIEAVMERAWDLHDKINDAIHNLSKSHFLNFIHKNSAIPSHPNPPFSAQPHWVKDELSNGHNGLESYTQQHRHIQNGDPTTQCGDFMQEADRFVETRSLNAIRNALEVLEDNLRFLHTMQLQQRADREAALIPSWNMKTWKPLTILPLGEDPPAVTSICFNHNGKILAASATDGMIHMFDMSAGLQITGWPAHDSAVSCVKFGPDEASIFSLGSDGKIFEWSLHNQGQVLWSQDCSRFCSLESFSLPRHEMALDANGRRLLVTSNTFTSPLYQIQGKTRGQKTLQHGAPITSVDWHPVMPIFLTGSADHSVHVTSIS